MRAVAVESEPVLGSWLARIGAALVAPKLALAASDGPSGQGRSSSDITLLLLLAVVALKAELFVISGWMVSGGDYQGALTVLMVGAREHLITPIVMLLVGSVVLSLLAGRRRSLARDFDLVCVALAPLVLIEILNALAVHAGLNVHSASVIVGYTWGGCLFVLAVLQARSRELPIKGTQTAHKESDD